MTVKDLPAPAAGTAVMVPLALLVEYMRLWGLEPLRFNGETLTCAESRGNDGTENL